MKLCNYSLFILLWLSAAGVIKAQSADPAFTVLVWNIWHGGNDESLPEDGRPHVIDIIRASEADVVLMIETYGSAPMIAEALGFDYHLISSNLCIFSRYSITRHFAFEEAIAPFNFGGVEIQVEDSIPVLFFDTWLHYLPDTRLAPTDSTEADMIAWEKRGSRDEEIEAILGVIQPFIEKADDVPVIMGGDFNSHSHLDWTPATRDTFFHGGAVVDWPISRAMTDAGFKDAFRQMYPDPLTHPGTTWLSVNIDGERKFIRKDRIDYLYYTGEKLRLTQAESRVAPDGQPFTFRGKQLMYPSDHGFVLATFEIQPD